MAAPDQVNPGEELTRRFRADLARPVGERFYSEDDLIDIFDYAGDIADDYLRMEALLLGARLYPDSVELTERRAIFYLYLDRRAFKAYLEDNPAVDTPLWQILRLNLLNPGDPAVERVLQSFVDHAGRLTDEEVIQLVQLAGSVGASDWVLGHLDDLRAHVDYLPTLLYEAAVQAEDRGLYDRAAELVAELTDLEPYNPDYWTMHASISVMRKRLDEAAADIDYALAIDPDNLEAMRAKLGVVAERGSADDFDDLADAILARDGADTETARIAIAHTDHIGRITAILDRLRGNARWTYELAASAAEVQYAHLDEILADLADQGLTEQAEWREIARRAYEAGAYGTLTTVMTVFKACTGDDLDCAAYLYQILYRTGHYDMVIQMYLASQDDYSLMEGGNTYKATVMFVLAMLRSGMTDAARSFLARLDSEMAAIGADGSDRLATFALRSFVDTTRRALDMHTNTDWSRYDPLGIDR